MKTLFTRLKNIAARQINALKSMGWRNLLGFLLMISLSALLVGTITWEIYEGYSLAANSSEKNLINQRLIKNTRIKAQSDPNKWTIFGQEETIAPTKVNKRLTLLGIIQSSNKQQNKAIIEQPDQDAEIYAIGDEIARGLTLHRVESDRVILKRFGTYETIFLVWDDKGATQPSTYKKPKKYSRKKSSTKSKKTSEAREKYMERIKKLRESGKFKEFFKNGYMDDMGGFGRLGRGWQGKYNRGTKDKAGSQHEEIDGEGMTEIRNRLKSLRNR